MKKGSDSLTIVDSDSEKGTITIIFQVVGKTTAAMSKMNVAMPSVPSRAPWAIPRILRKSGWSFASGGAWASVSFTPWRLP